MTDKSPSTHFIWRAQRKLKRDFQQARWKGVARGLAHSIGQLLVRPVEIVFFRRPLDMELPDSRQLNTASYRAMTPADIDDIGFIDEWKKQQLRKHFDEGSQGWLCSVEGRICGFHFSSLKTTREGETGALIELKPGQVYQFDCLIDPDERGKKLMANQLSRFLHDMHGQGLSEVISGVHRGNLASERLHEQLGFTPFAVYRELRICGVTAWRQKALKPIDEPSA